VIKALVDQSAVVVPEASAQNGHLQNALDIRNHILSNPNSTAHLQIKKKKSRSSSVSSARTESCSEGSTSELAQDQDETGVLLRAVQSKCQELEDKYTSRVLDDQRAAEEKKKKQAVAHLAAPGASLAAKNNSALLQNVVSMAMQAQGQGQLFGQNPLLWQQLPLAVSNVSPCGMQEKSASLFGGQILAHRTNLNTQQALLQMQMMAMQNNLSLQALLNNT